MVVKKKYAALGRGLDALISTEDVRIEGSSSISEISTAQIEPNPNQPRREFDILALEELADSIKEIGIIQPITLRKINEEKYQIIAGERRWRASQIAGLTSVPAYIRTADDENVMQMALVENIQREDLNAIEIALAYQNLIEQHNLTQEGLSKKVGKQRTTIANALRLLKLPAPVQMALKRKEIDQGHARALLGLESPSMQIKLFQNILLHGYSVRKVEEEVRRLNNPAELPATEPSKKSPRTPVEYTLLKDQLATFFQSKVTLTCSPEGKGKISIPFASEEDLERIISLFDRMK